MFMAVKVATGITIIISIVEVVIVRAKKDHFE